MAAVARRRLTHLHALVAQATGRRFAEAMCDSAIMIAQLELAVGTEQVADMVRIKMARASEFVQFEEDLAAARAAKGAAK